MSTQFKLVVSDDKPGTERPLDSRELLPWNVSEAIRDHFRRVRSTLPLLNREDALCIAVSSTCRGEGVSWVTAMLSCAIAQESGPVFVIDYNRSHPSQNAIFGVDRDPGEPMTQPDTIDLVSRLVPGFGIRILTAQAGTVKEKGCAISLRDALPHLRRQCKAILIDCEPMRDSSGLLDLAPAIDGVIFVSQVERERRQVIARNLESIRRAGLRIFGMVLNKRKRYIPGWLYRAI